MAYHLKVLQRAEQPVALTGFDDPCLMSYALDAGRAEHLPEQLAGSLLSYTCLTQKEIMGTGRGAVTFERVPVARATEFAGEEAAASFSTSDLLWWGDHAVLARRLREDGLVVLFARRLVEA